MTSNWQPAPGRRALLIAHRGAAHVAPENTLPAIESALEAGADVIEVDVQRTNDGVLVLVHDDNWRRTTGTDADVRELDWNRVRRLDAGAWFAATYRGVSPPRLDDVLDAVRGRAALDIEIKSPQRDAGLASAVVACVRAHAMQQSVLLTSFDHACIDAIAQTKPDIALGYIAEHAVARGHEGVAYYAYEARMLLRSPMAVAAARQRGGQVLAWTVDDARAADELMTLGVAGIVTNRPADMAPILALER